MNILELERAAIALDDEFEQAGREISDDLSFEEASVYDRAIGERYLPACDEIRDELLSALPSIFDEVMAKVRFYYRIADGGHDERAAADLLDSLCSVALDRTVRLDRPIGYDPRMIADPDLRVPRKLRAEFDRLASAHKHGVLRAKEGYDHRFRRRKAERPA